MRKDQIGEIAVFANQNSIFTSGTLDMLHIAGHRASERGAQNLVASIHKGLGNAQTLVDIEQESQAALA